MISKPKVAATSLSVSIISVLYDLLVKHTAARFVQKKMWIFKKEFSRFLWHVRNMKHKPFSYPFSTKF